MNDRYSRTQLLIGKEAVQKLKAARVAVFGLGGVGGFAAEALARAGVGSFILVDEDNVETTNLNRQIIATSETLGMLKTRAMRGRLLSIDPEIKVIEYNIFFSGGTAEQIDLSGVSYIIDAIDTVASKLLLVKLAKEKNISVISSMGAGNKLDCTRFKTADIYKTSVCPLARIMRRELKRLGVESLKVVYSDEPPISLASENPEPVRRPPASISYVPAAAGLLLAQNVILDLIGN